MGKSKRKLSAAEKTARRWRRKNFMTIFINGKQKRVRRPPSIDGMDVDEFIRRNADPIWLVQNEMWEYLDAPAPRKIEDPPAITDEITDFEDESSDEYIDVMPYDAAMKMEAEDLPF